eukprot:jgi/Botrbrau1/5058/Bobra.37_1s0023.1
MDFHGQRLSEQLCMYIILVAGVISFVTGYARGNFSLMLQIFGGGVALAAIATIPDYPWYNRHAEKWLPPMRDRDKPEEPAPKKEKRRDR